MKKPYKRPIIQVRNVSYTPSYIAQVETAIPAFIGYTKKAKKNDQDLTITPTKISSLNEYENFFGTSQNEKNIVATLIDTINNNGNTQVSNQKITINNTAPSPFTMYYALQQFFANGGTSCYIVSVGDYDSTTISKNQLLNGLYAVENYKEPTLLVFPDALAISTADNYYDVIHQALQQAKQLKDRFVIADTYANNPATVRNTNSLGSDTELLKYGAVYYPYLKTLLPYAFEDADITIQHENIDENGVQSVGSLNGLSLTDLKIGGSHENTALFNTIKNKLDQETVTLPPSSAMAGIYGRVDADRGVWKAPANVSVSGSIKPTQNITDAEQQNLNVHSSGKSINAIRQFPGKGILVWGARTLASNDNEWRYISVSRFGIMVETSINRAIYTCLNEPNNSNTWQQIKAIIENFLTLQWQNGALSGSTPDHAFFVNIGLGQSMTQSDILDGLLKIEIGIAPTRPAEFIVLRLTYKMQQN
ncbi:phage tail sheath family protein [Marixanthomonas ophiurae]|uniref:Phage tail sheath family protein n=1 Tax=Marixanthomonas ophiurae TaxID=387659 RepID=A0A3E1Q8N6_9FLAO|nr:phage tail sheath subtilisin-like domain-containing protein [Marixanthomonas ophiurae]RFN58482.1 phage tail sheath family protein [Marixanthomonas ophiurae]